MSASPEQGPRLAQYEVTVAGQPVAWQRAGSKGSHRYTPPRLRDHERLIADHVALTWRRPPLRCPVRLTLYFFMHGRTSADVDNLAKTVLDALNGVLYEDDRQVERLVVNRVQGFTRNAAGTSIHAAWEETS
jgi:crossover junction endodeoxyribonuclease RusA